MRTVNDFLSYREDEKYAAQADSLREQIGSFEKNADILNAQILAPDGGGPERLSGEAR